MGGKSIGATRGWAFDTPLRHCSRADRRPPGAELGIWRAWAGVFTHRTPISPEDNEPQVVQPTDAGNIVPWPVATVA
jgi:hypothetical protein